MVNLRKTLCAGLRVFALVSCLGTGLIAADCMTNMTFHYDSQGQIISIDVFCSGSCDGTAACTLFSAGTLLWCECNPTGSGLDCIGFAAAGGMRCLKVDCEESCISKSVSWTTPETGKTHTQEWCSCE